MVKRLTGAFARAFLVVLLIATPGLLLPGVSSNATQIGALIAVFAAALTLFEYASTSPSLVEFRDAPPFNRLRFVALFSTVFLLTLICRGKTQPTLLTDLVGNVGAIIAHAIDFPYSPVRLMMLLLPEDASTDLINATRTAAGLSYLISLLSLAAFVVVLRVNNWPVHNATFNVWINLPTFEPTSGGDVVERLYRDGRINTALGFLLPFLIPVVMSYGFDVFNPLSVSSPQTMIWTMTAWAFLPSSLFMRGIALGRVAHMIAEKRRRSMAEVASERFAPA